MTKKDLFSLARGPMIKITWSKTNASNPKALIKIVSNVASGWKIMWNPKKNTIKVMMKIRIPKSYCFFCLFQRIEEYPTLIMHSQFFVHRGKWAD